MDDRLAARLHRGGPPLRARTSRRTIAGKKIAIIYQNDDYGKDYLYGFRAALGKTYADANVVAQEAVETTATSVAAQMIAHPGERCARSSRSSSCRGRAVTTIATAKALGVNPDQIYLNSVAAIKPVMDGAGGGAAERRYVNGVITTSTSRIQPIRAGPTTQR